MWGKGISASEATFSTAITQWTRFESARFSPENLPTKPAWEKYQQKKNNLP